MFRLVFQNGSIYLILGELKKILKKKKKRKRESARGMEGY